MKYVQEQIIEAITTGVRFLSLDQITRFWYGGDSDEAHQVIGELEERQLVVIESHLVHPEFEVIDPEFVWSPGDPEPDFSPVAYRLRKRFGEQKVMLDLVFPEKLACERYGGTRLRPRVSEVSHDLHLGAVYLAMRETVRNDSEVHWVSGDSLRADGKTHQFQGAVPDAVLADSAGAVTTIIEGGGRYSKGKLESLHRVYCSTAYQIW